MSKGAKTQTATVKTPKYQEDAYKDLYAMGKAEATKPYVPYTGQMFADRNSLQTGAMNQAVDMANEANRFDPTANLMNLAGMNPNTIRDTGYQANLGRVGDFSGAQNMRSQVREAGNQSILPNVGNYMNAFTDGTTNIGLRQLDENRLKQLQQDQDTQIGRGAFGGSRGALMEAETNKNFDQAKSDFVAKQNQQNFQNAMKFANMEQDRQLKATSLDAGMDKDLALANQQALQQAGLQNQEIGQGYFDKLAEMQYGQAQLENERNIKQGALTDSERSRMQSIYNDILGAQQSGIQNLTSQGILQNEFDQAKLNENYRQFLEERDFGARNLGLYTSAVSGVPFMGATSTRQDKKTGFGDVLGAFSTMGSAYLGGKSDARLKTNIRKLGSHNGINIYSWTWNKLAKSMNIHLDNPRTIGVMAQEVMHIPGIVNLDDDGFYSVNYGALNEI